MMRALITASLLLILTGAANAMGPPAVEWERLYGSVFYDVQETSNGNFIVAGRKWYSDFKKTVFLYSPSGNQIWEYGESAYPNNLIGYAVIELPSGDFVATGYGIPEASSTQTSLSIYKISSDGQAIWSKLYLLEDNSRSYGYSIAQLPDGGFALCGRTDPTEGMPQAWILRTDSQGDTLWTIEWGGVRWDEAKAIQYIDNGLTVLAQGRTTAIPGGDPFFLRYDMEGNLLWEKKLDFPAPGGLAGHAQDMCRASDGGLLVLDNYHPEIAHYDLQGNYHWYFNPPGWGSNYGWSIESTMDGGILFGGENAEYIPGESNTDLSGMISRHDSLGNELWRDYVYNSGCTAIYSAIQLSNGGYIAAGKAYSSITDATLGFLIKYAPETGIEDAETASSVELNLSPNPFSSTLSLTFSLPEEMNASVSVFDLNGRMVGNISNGVFPAGTNTFEWDVPDELSSGCYMVRLDSAYGSFTENCVLLR